MTEELQKARDELKALGVIGYDSYDGVSSVEAVHSTIAFLKEYDKKAPPEKIIEHIREIELERRKKG